MVLRLELFDLLDQLFLCMLDMDLVDAIGVLCARRTPLTRCPTIALSYILVKRTLALSTMKGSFARGSECYEEMKAYLCSSLFTVETGISSYRLWHFPSLGIIDILFTAATAWIGSRTLGGG
jgi:hypothetical protein